MEIDNLFKDKDKEKGVDVTDLINKIVQVLKEDLYWFRTSVQEAELLKPVKLGNEG